MKQLRMGIFGAIVGVTVLPGAVPADSPVDRGYADPKLEFEKYKLDNGLEVILHQDNRVPLVAVNIW